MFLRVVDFSVKKWH